MGERFAARRRYKGAGGLKTYRRLDLHTGQPRSPRIGIKSREILLEAMFQVPASRAFVVACKKPVFCELRQGGVQNVSGERLKIFAMCHYRDVRQVTLAGT